MTQAIGQELEDYFSQEEFQRQYEQPTTYRPSPTEIKNFNRMLLNDAGKLRLDADRPGWGRYKILNVPFMENKIYQKNELEPHTT